MVELKKCNDEDIYTILINAWIKQRIPISLIWIPLFLKIDYFCYFVVRRDIKRPAELRTIIKVVNNSETASVRIIIHPKHIIFLYFRNTDELIIYSVAHAKTVPIKVRHTSTWNPK